MSAANALASPRLALYTYDLVSGLVNERSSQVDSLEFVTTQPGGYSELTCNLRVPNGVLATTPDLGLFARVALTDGLAHPFLGRWDEPALALTNSDGDVYQLHAMGAADCFKDDPEDVAYSNQTGKAIIVDQISTFTVGGVARSQFLPIDQDTSGILPDNPAQTYSPDPNSKNIEDVLNEVLPVIGDYAWCVWGHPTNRDAAGFPTWQLVVHQRDTTTIAYTGYLSGEGGGGSDAYTIRPAVEYSYNVIQLKYRDATSDLPSSVTVRDSRLASNNTQGTAPIPFRKLVKDFSSDHLTATEATAVANALLAQYQNGGFKNEVVLSRVFDANGVEIPLWQVRADGNIFLPELTPLGAQLTTAATSGVNLFYITQTRYSEGVGQTPTLTVTLDSFWDTAAFQIARMEYVHKKKAASTKKKHVVREAGNYETGTGAVGWGSTAVAGDIYACGVNFKTALSAAPTSITLAASHSTNVASIGTSDVSNTGFSLNATVNANGAGSWAGKYTTHGN